MAFQSVPNCAEADVLFSGNGVLMEHSLKFKFLDGTYGQADIDALAAAVDDWAGALYPAVLSGDVSYLRTEVHGLTSLVDLQASANAGASIGGVSSSPLPFNVSLAVKFSTGLTGRSARGRAYMIGLPSTQIAATDNFMNSTYETNVLALWNGLDGYISPGGWGHVVVSRFSAGAPRTTGVSFLITSYVLNDLRVDSQRSRLPS